jgi:hypothetical protein
VGTIPTAPKIKPANDVQNIMLNISDLKSEIKGNSCQSICNISDRIGSTDTGW